MTTRLADQLAHGDQPRQSGAHHRHAKHTSPARLTLPLLPSSSHADDPLLLRLVKLILYTSITNWVAPTPAQPCGKRMRVRARPAGRLKHAEAAEDG